MDTYSPAGARLKARVPDSRSGKIRSGFSTVVGAAIMIAVVSLLGSAMVIWGNSHFNFQQKQMGDYYVQNSNLLKENFIIEDVWLSTAPASNYVNVTLRNIGNIAINATQVTVTDLDSSGNPLPSSNCASPTKCSVTVKTPYAKNRANGWIQSNGLISSNKTLRIDAGNMCWQTCGAASVSISVTTSRGSIQTVIWKVS